MRIPSSTYRLQFNAHFRLTDASRIVEYLRDLGITDVYASPLLNARAGSVHGYDVTDPTTINPEIGSPNELSRFSTELRSMGLGLLLDIVPNHMAASEENPWWKDILARGEASPYASFFDVDWSSGKLLLPILAKSYGECLESGELAIRRRNGGFRLTYFGHELPVTLPANVEEPSRIEDVDRIIAAQPYRPTHWRKAADSINYRRFLDVNDLVGLRAERDDVFRATHAAVLDLVNRGDVTGLRIDHIDGLRDPKEYLDRLPPIYVITENILGSDEDIPPDWKAHGTTGYDFLNIVNGAFVDPSGFEELERIYARFTGRKQTAVEVCRERKRQVMKELFASEIAALSKRLIELAQPHRHARDLVNAEIRDALVTVTACLPVYRTYIRGCTVCDTDRTIIEDAVAAAGCQRLCKALEFLREVLLLNPPDYLRNQLPDYVEFVMRWQQFTGAVMAKGLEDTTFYVHNPLISLNEVGAGSNGPQPYLGVHEFHRRNASRRAQTPLTMNATSTHDTKRSEDVRARINVLSEMPAEWQQFLERWGRSDRTGWSPAPNELVFIYQTLLGAWPISRERLHAYIVKALREAKEHTSWIRIDEAYERRVLAFVDRMMNSHRSEPFLHDFLRLHKAVAFFGAINSIAQTLLKIASPGVPDFYQGCELWDFSLADPDNRRPVDFEERVRALNWVRRNGCPRELLRTWNDGRVKLFVLWKALNFRNEHPDLFLEGEYTPVEVRGAHANNVIAFTRERGNARALVVVPRLTSQVTRPGRFPTGESVWGNTEILLPGNGKSEWKNVLTGESSGSPGRVAELLSEFPVALATAA